MKKFALLALSITISVATLKTAYAGVTEIDSLETKASILTIKGEQIPDDIQLYMITPFADSQDLKNIELAAKKIHDISEIHWQQLAMKENSSYRNAIKQNKIFDLATTKVEEWKYPPYLKSYKGLLYLTRYMKTENALYNVLTQYEDEKLQKLIDMTFNKKQIAYIKGLFDMKTGRTEQAIQVFIELAEKGHKQALEKANIILSSSDYKMARLEYQKRLEYSNKLARLNNQEAPTLSDSEAKQEYRLRAYTTYKSMDSELSFNAWYLQHLENASKEGDLIARELLYQAYLNGEQGLSNLSNEKRLKYLEDKAQEDPAAQKYVNMAYKDGKLGLDVLSERQRFVYLKRRAQKKDKDIQNFVARAYYFGDHSYVNELSREERLEYLKEQALEGDIKAQSYIVADYVNSSRSGGNKSIKEGDYLKVDYFYSIYNLTFFPEKDGDLKNISYNKRTAVH